MKNIKLLKRISNIIIIIMLICLTALLMKFYYDKGVLTIVFLLLLSILSSNVDAEYALRNVNKFYHGDSLTVFCIMKALMTATFLVILLLLTFCSVGFIFSLPLPELCLLFSLLSVPLSLVGIVVKYIYLSIWGSDCDYESYVKFLISNFRKED